MEKRNHEGSLQADNTGTHSLAYAKRHWALTLVISLLLLIGAFIAFWPRGARAPGSHSTGSTKAGSTAPSEAPDVTPPDPATGVSAPR